MVPVTMPKRVTMPVGMAIIIFFQGISNLLCTPVVGYIIGEAQVWTNVAPLCAATAAVGTVLWIVYVLTKPPVFEEDEGNAETASIVDAVSGATSLADAAVALDPHRNAATVSPPPCPPPGMGAGTTSTETEGADAATGATPGVASACQELGMASVSDVVRERGIKPPGMA